MAERYYPSSLDELAEILRHYGRRYPSTSFFIYFHLRDVGVDYINNIRRAYIEFLDEYQLNLPRPSYTSFRRLINELIRKGAIRHSFWGEPPSDNLVQTHYVELTDDGRDIRHPAWWNPFKAPLIRSGGSGEGFGQRIVSEEETSISVQEGVKTRVTEVTESTVSKTVIRDIIREIESRDAVDAILYVISQDLNSIRESVSSSDVEYLESQLNRISSENGRIVDGINILYNAVKYSAIRLVAEYILNRVTAQIALDYIDMLTSRMCSGGEITFSDVYFILVTPVVAEPNIAYLNTLRIIAYRSTISDIYKALWNTISSLYSSDTIWSNNVRTLIEREYGESDISIISSEAEYMGEEILGDICGTG